MDFGDRSVNNNYYYFEILSEEFKENPYTKFIGMHIGDHIGITIPSESMG